MQSPTIILATDLSNDSAHAADWSMRWSDHVRGARVVAVHAVSANELVLRRIVSGRTEGRELLAIRDEVVAFLEEHTGRRADRVIVEIGPAARVLATAADAHQADWLVASMSGRGAATRLLLGSTVQRLAHRPPAPLVICPSGDFPWSRAALPGHPRILAALDLSAPGFAAALHAASIARTLDASLLLFHVVDLPRLVPTPGDTEALPATLTEHVERSTRWARDEITSFIARNPAAFQDLTPTIEVTAGYPSRELLARTRELDADLLVLGNTGRGAFGDLLMGSVANTIVNRAPCTLVLVPSS